MMSRGTTLCSCLQVPAPIGTAQRFLTVTRASGGPLDNPTARLRLRALEARLAEDRLVLNEGRFFDRRGRRLTIEEVTR